MQATEDFGEPHQRTVERCRILGVQRRREGADEHRDE
jgi:hypothetical protein